jgi:hypothetical protein
MGYIRNHAIVVTSTYGDYIQQAHVAAKEIFPWVSEISDTGINGSRSFFIPPDGSKEGWEDSDLGDDRRNRFKEWLRLQEYDDESSPLAWCEVWYGGDDEDANVEDHCHQKRPRKTTTKGPL